MTLNLTLGRELAAILSGVSHNPGVGSGCDRPGKAPRSLRCGSDGGGDEAPGQVLGSIQPATPLRHRGRRRRGGDALFTGGSGCGAGG